MAEVIRIPVADVFPENCYLYGDPDSHHAVLIDPGAQAGNIAGWAESNGWIIDRILLTHGHFDHTGAVNELRKRWDIPVCASQNSDLYLLDPVLNLSERNGRHTVVEGARHFREGENVLPDTMTGELIAVSVPGHTPDSTMFVDPNAHIAFVGDTIFRGEPGIWSFPGGSREELLESIRNRILSLPDQTLLLSGHSDPTTVEAEKPRYFR